MHLHTLIPFAIALLAWTGSVHAMNEQWDQDCNNQAKRYCPNTPSSAQAYQIYYQDCMFHTWAKSSNNDKCPHREDNCRCYNACVADRHRDVQDVGSYCRVQCKPVGRFLKCGS